MYEGTPIHTLSAGWFIANFRKRVLTWLAMCGIKEPPDEYTEQILLETFRDEWRHYTFEEFDLAFKMNQLGEFGDVIEAYQEFNIRFVSKVLKAYKSKRLVLDKIYRHEKYRLLELPKPVTDPFQLDQGIAIAEFNIYEQWKGDKELYGKDLPGASVSYDVLTRFGLMTVSEPAYDQAIAMAHATIEAKFKAAINPDEKHRWGRKLADEAKLNAAATVIAKKALVLGYYEQLEKTDTDFGEILIRAVCAVHSRPDDSYFNKNSLNSLKQN